MTQSKNIVIAKITSAHGIKGYVKIISFASNPSDIIKYSDKVFDQKNQPYKIKIIGAVPNQNNDLFIAQIEGVNDRTSAEMLRGIELSIERKYLPKAKKGEFYYIDLVGLEVRDLENKIIGKVLEVNDFGAGGVVEIDFNGRAENFSFTNQIFPEVNLDEGYLVIDIPDAIEVKDAI